MNEVCFLCLTESSSYTLVEDESHEICQQILKCLQLKVHFESVKTAKICNNCLEHLLQAHGFFTKIHKIHASEFADVQIQLLPVEQETKSLLINQETLTLNNNCIESLKDNELDIKNEPIETERFEQSYEEYKADSDEHSDEETKTTTALATIKNWKSYPWYCYLCIYSTLNFSTLMGHMKTKHDISSTKKIQFQCVDCTRKINTYYLFLNHVRLEHQPDLKRCCDICSEHFSSYTLLSAHRREHKDQTEMQQPDVFHCDHCSKVYPSTKAINKHVMTHKQGLQCKICEKSFKCLKYLKRHMEIHTELKHKCDFCKKTFHRKFNKINHERTHTGERPYSCDVCQKMFRFQSTLKSHQRTHTGEQPYKCEHCSSEFRHHDTLKEHMRKHTQESPFSCSKCDETFRYRKSLNRHMRLHNEKKAVTRESNSTTAKNSASAFKPKEHSEKPRKTRTRLAA